MSIFLSIYSVNALWLIPLSCNCYSYFYQHAFNQNATFSNIVLSLCLNHKVIIQCFRMFMVGQILNNLINVIYKGNERHFGTGWRLDWALPLSHPLQRTKGQSYLWLQELVEFYSNHIQTVKELRPTTRQFGNLSFNIKYKLDETFSLV